MTIRVDRCDIEFWIFLILVALFGVGMAWFTHSPQAERMWQQLNRPNCNCYVQCECPEEGDE